MSDSPTPYLHKILSAAVKSGVSDIHLTEGTKPDVRLNGDIRALDTGELSHDQMVEILGTLSPDASLVDGFKAHPNQPVDLAYTFEKARDGKDVYYRASIARSRAGYTAVMRQFPDIIPMDSLGISTKFQNMTKLPSGLVLVVGATGSGKSTSLAAMIDRINTTQAKKVFTIEDPIEFVHPIDKKSAMVQLEVGDRPSNHVESFAAGLRTAMRQDPDVMLVGEIRDLETAKIALSASETGHVVYSTLHTNNTTASIGRLLKLFPQEEQPAARTAIAEVLRAVCFQMLIPRLNDQGGGRVAARELLFTTSKIKELIQDDEIAQIREIMKSDGGADGHVVLIDDIVDLAEKEIIDPRVAAQKLVGLNPTPGSKMTPMSTTIMRMYEEELSRGSGPS